MVNRTLEPRSVKPENWQEFTPVTVADIPALVGLAELLSRHKDYPRKAAFSTPSLGYVVLNGALSMLALLIVSLSPPDWLISTR